ncbi:MAG: hypothetical protein V4819_21860 [Verrucomicrobiota bacterium]
MVNSRSIQGILVLIVATFLAVWLGLSIVTNQIETILQVMAAAVLILCLFLGRRIWLLIPFMAALDLSLRIPGQPSSLLLGQLLVLGFCTLLFMMRKLPFKLEVSELEIWVMILTFFVVQVYLRNPVGVNIFGGDTVGGKGYALYAIAVASALLLSGLRVPASELKWILRVSIVGGLLNGAISVLGSYVSIIGYYTGAEFEDPADAGFEGEVVDARAATRVGFLLGLGNNLSLWISSYISPLRACVRPMWAVLVLMALVAATMSGFRNGIITVGLTFLIGIAYRGGLSGVAISVFGLVGGLSLLAVVNSMSPLPPNIQRSLTFLPGTWERRYKEDAAGSSEWRLEIWREVLLTDRWIQNKWIGDGLGFSAAELAGQMNTRKGARSGISGFDPHREAILASGDYHSGPVSTIRVIGYVGLAFFLLAQIRLAVHAHRQIRRCLGTEWLPLALIVGIPVIMAPIVYVFIFGDFKTNTALYLMSLGMIRLLQKNLPLPVYASHRRAPFVLGTANRLREVAQPAGSNRQRA